MHGRLAVGDNDERLVEQLDAPLVHHRVEDAVDLALRGGPVANKRTSQDLGYCGILTRESMPSE